MDADTGEKIPSELVSKLTGGEASGGIETDHADIDNPSSSRGFDNCGQTIRKRTIGQVSVRVDDLRFGHIKKLAK